VSRRRCFALDCEFVKFFYFRFIEIIFYRVPLLRKSTVTPRHIVNVSAMEGKFYKHKVFREIFSCVVGQMYFSILEWSSCAYKRGKSSPQHDYTHIGVVVSQRRQYYDEQRRHRMVLSKNVCVLKYYKRQQQQTNKKGDR
jgi:hypothetical protein